MSSEQETVISLSAVSSPPKVALQDGAIKHRPRLRHGESVRGQVTPEYRAWQNMKSRCFNPNARGYEYYGGRGIKVAPGFLVYEAFLACVGRRPSAGYSLDRIDNNGDYAPGNVRWVLRKDQNANRRPSSEWRSRKRKDCSCGSGEGRTRWAMERETTTAPLS